VLQEKEKSWVLPTYLLMISGLKSWGTSKEGVANVVYSAKSTFGLRNKI
jgi:hypothetical protein